LNPFATTLSENMNTLLQEYIPGGAHSNFQNFGKRKQIHFQRGEGTSLWDVDGNMYLDFNCKSGANILGHSNPEYINRIKDSLDNVTAVDLHDTEIEVCQKIIEAVPCAERIRFSLSGSEAIQNAIRLSRAYTGKERLLRFNKNYHGSFDNILGGIATDREYPIPNSQDPLKETMGRAKNILEDQNFIIQWNDPEALEITVDKYHSEIACIITEPISVNGGGILPIDGYLQKMRTLCTKYNIALIFDEIITGFRVAYGGGQEIYNITPDLTILGKAIGGGSLPVSAIVGNKDIMSLYEKRQVVHGGTFNGYKVGLAAVDATLSILNRDKETTYKEMIHAGTVLRELYLFYAQKYGIRTILKGHETCLVIDFHDEDDQPLYSSEKISKLVEALLLEELLSHGLYLTNGNRFYMNASINSKDLDRFEIYIESAMKSLAEKINKLKII
jgi:glutamate-1-semialdehyde aminotransferase